MWFGFERGVKYQNGWAVFEKQFHELGKTLMIARGRGSNYLNYCVYICKVEARSPLSTVDEEYSQKAPRLTEKSHIRYNYKLKQD